jgi:hypothetical protein
MTTEYYVVVNDNSMPQISQPCITGPGDDLDFYTDKAKALDRRDEIREEYDNPGINVYRLTMHHGPVTRGSEVEQ